MNSIYARPHRSSINEPQSISGSEASMIPATSRPRKPSVTEEPKSRPRRPSVTEKSLDLPGILV
jgi:hypothetical protein